jgi:hypothetical protein
MIGFESFLVRDWMDGALTIWTDATKANVKDRAAKAVKHAVSTAVVSAGLTFMASVAVAEVAQTQLVSSVPTLTAPSAPAGIDQVPVGYWPGLLTQMRAWKPALDDSTLSLPPPTF